MKKIIISFAATLTVSSPVAIVAQSINANLKNLPNKEGQQKEINLVLEQVGKALFLNQKYGYDFNYVFDSLIKNQQIQNLNSSIKFDYDSKFNGYNRYFEVYEKNFTKNLMAKDVELKGFSFENRINPDQNSSSLLAALANLLPTITKFIANKDIFGMAVYLLNTFITVNPEMISKNVLLQFAKPLLTDANLEKLADAFGAKKYSEFNVQQALDSSLIGLVNGLSKLVNTNKVFENNSVKSTEENFTPAMKELENIASIITSDSNSLNFDLVENLDSIIEIVGFARVLIVYVNSYIKQANPKGELEQSDLQNKPISYEQIEEFRKTKFDNAINQVDLKELFIYLQSMIANDSGEGLRNLIAILFVEKPKKDYEEIQLKVKDDIAMLSVTDILTAIANKDYQKIIDPFLGLLKNFNEFISKNSIIRYSKNAGLSAMFEALLNGAINNNQKNQNEISKLLKLNEMKTGSLLTNVLGIMGSGVSIMDQSIHLLFLISLKTVQSLIIGIVPENYKELVTSIFSFFRFDFNLLLAPGGLITKKEQGFKNLWNNEKILGSLLELLGINGITSLRSIFTKPLDKILPEQGILGLNSNKSIQTIVNEVLEKLEKDDTKLVKIDFNNVEGLFLKLKGVVDLALTDPAKLFEKLGLNENKTIRQDSALDYIQKLSIDLSGIDAITDQIKDGAKYQAEINLKIAQKIKSDFEKMSKPEIDVIDDNNFKYTFNNISIQFTIKSHLEKWIISKIYVSQSN